MVPSEPVCCTDGESDSSVLPTPHTSRLRLIKRLAEEHAEERRESAESERMRIGSVIYDVVSDVGDDEVEG